jgi:hypothetical protein
LGALARPAPAATPAPAVRLTVRSLMVVMTFSSICALATKVSLDPDTWWHLRAGQWMLEHHQILTYDPFSWTRAGTLWINHSWMSQVPMYLLWKGFGFAGLNLLTAVCATLAFWFVYLQTEGSVYLRAFVVMLAAVSSAVYWWARPEMISFALAAGFAYILGLYRWQGINRLWLLPPLMGVWVNVHGGFVIGLLLLIITLVGQGVSRLCGQRGPGVLEGARLPWLAFAGAACAAAVVANPYGLRMFVYPLQTVSIGALRDFIHEWMSPDFHAPETQGFVWLLLGTVAAVGLSRRRIDLTDLLLFCGFAYLALLARRNIALFALIAAPVLARHAAAGLESSGERFPAFRAIISRGDGADPPHTALNWALLALIVALAVAKMSVPLQPSVNQAAIEKTMPVGAVDYIHTARPPGPILNSYNWGGYLVWALAPGYPVYIDGRTDLYGDAFLSQYMRVVYGEDEWRAVFARDNIRLVVIESASPLARKLNHEPGWRRGYVDALSSVFQRE